MELMEHLAEQLHGGGFENGTGTLYTRCLFFCHGGVARGYYSYELPNATELREQRKLFGEYENCGWLGNILTMFYLHGLFICPCRRFK